jgi:hypothetical protein
MSDWSKDAIRADADALVDDPTGYFLRCRAQAAIDAHEYVSREIDRIVAVRRTERKAARRHRLARLTGWLGAATRKVTR